MKFTKAIALSLAALVAAGAIAGCGDQKKEAKAPADKKEITVGITSGYSEQVMDFVAKKAEPQDLRRLCHPGCGSRCRRDRPELLPARPVPRSLQ